LVKNALIRIGAFFVLFHPVVAEISGFGAFGPLRTRSKSHVLLKRSNFPAKIVNFEELYRDTLTRN
jgi:hypothetical protein